tara:strand:- start:6711 stop:7163 length:453 start_codon:yes stop_codon:yes gene_type:complete
VLKKKNLTISVAESCTSGLLASHLTDIIGSGQYFMGGVIAYNRIVKTELLNVPENIEVVSPKTVVAMNAGLKNLITSDIQVSVTGYIGTNYYKPELSNTVYYGIFYNYIDTIFKITLPENYPARLGAKLAIVSNIINNIYRIITHDSYFI